MKIRILHIGIASCLVGFNANAYGPEGHKLIGDVGGKVLEGKPAAQKVNTLLNGMSLGQAAQLPDDIKGWDKTPPDKPKAFQIKNNPQLDAQLVAFWRANSQDGPGGQPLHREFHFTDIPVKDVEKYADGKVGRSDTDLVKMITYCAKVLQKKIPENNQHKITRPVAVVLLAHYLGDLHQPLHVGAEYFDNQNLTCNPDKPGVTGIPDMGGNSLNAAIDGVFTGVGSSSKNLHSVWDGDSVQRALLYVKAELHPGNSATLKYSETVRYFATKEPNWKIASTIPVEKWSETWANEAQPIAKQAHDRLQFVHMKAVTMHGTKIESGTAKEIPTPDHVAYLDWAGRVVKEEIGRAGWRLAAILEKTLE